MTNLKHITDYSVSATLQNSVLASSGWSSITTSNQIDEVNKRLLEIENRLAIILPNEELLNKFPALKEAYDNYKLIEKLVKSNET